MKGSKYEVENTPRASNQHPGSPLSPKMLVLPTRRALRAAYSIFPVGPLHQLGNKRGSDDGWPHLGLGKVVRPGSGAGVGYKLR